jgi:hypothetical protein
MTDSTKIQLICILIHDDLKVRDSPFSIKVPREEDFGGIIHYVKEVTPSLKAKDHRKFKFYKPPLEHPICISHSLSGFQLSQEHLASPLLITCKVQDEFQEKGTDRHSDVDLVVHVNSRNLSAPSTL